MSMTQIEARERQHRLKGIELDNRVQIAKKNGTLKSVDADIKQWLAESDRLKSDKDKAVQAALKGFGGGGSAAAEMKDGSRSWLPTAAGIPEGEWRGLYEATQRKMNYRIEQKTPFSDSVEFKTNTPFGEGNFTSGGLPPVLMPSLTLPLPLEPDRAFSHFTQLVAPEASSVEYIRHTSNAGSAGVTAELAAKPALNMTLTTVTTSFTKIAALQTFSEEAISDFSTFMTFVPAALMSAVIDAETNWIVNTELAGVSGVLTRSVGADSPLTAVRKAFNDIRTGAAFGKADLVLMHPSTLTNLQTQTTTGGLYVLAPNDPSSIADVDELWGAKVITNTYVPAGTAYVFDTAKSCLAWTRWGLRIDMNATGSDGTTNFWEQNVICQWTS
jgi:Phage capsid family